MNDLINDFYDRFLYDHFHRFLSPFYEARVRRTIIGAYHCTFEAVRNHPYNVAATLLRVGYDPFPIQDGLKYQIINTHYIKHGLTLFAVYQYSLSNPLCMLTGLGMAPVQRCIYRATKYLAHKACDNFHFNWHFGVTVPELEAQEDTLEHIESFRVHFRNLFVNSAVTVVSTFLTHPIYVVTIRQIAQMFSQGSAQYFFPLLWKIMREEGRQGLMAGIGARIFRNLVYLWGASAAIYVVERVVMMNVYELARNHGHIYVTRAYKMSKCVHLCLKGVVMASIESYDYIATNRALGSERGYSMHLLPLEIPPFKVIKDTIISLGKETVMNADFHFRLLRDIVIPGFNFFF